jgi:hypothetical protein
MQELNKPVGKNNELSVTPPSVLYLLKPIICYQARKHGHTKPVIV